MRVRMQKMWSCKRVLQPGKTALKLENRFLISHEKIHRGNNRDRAERVIREVRNQRRS